MKAKTLIKKLEKLVEKHGNKDIILSVADDPSWKWCIDTVDFEKYNKKIEIYGD